MNRTSELIKRSIAATSYDYFGDESFREGLERLVTSADEEADLTDRGRAVFDHQIVGMLSNRLQVEHWYQLHPEIDAETISAPLIGLGLPRTGSTALSFLLAEDPATRSIRTWESIRPCPPPEAATQLNDPRIAETDAMMTSQDRLFPRLRAMLPTSTTGPIECQHFMGYDFKSQIFQASAWIPSYVEWLNHEADLVATYRYVERVLKLLQWHCPPKRWRLKNPAHTLFITALIKVFPDARFWMTHRDIASVIPSVADLYFEMQRPFRRQVDKHALGRLVTDFCELGMRRMIAFRDAGNDHRFFDIYFATMQNDPTPMLADLYAFLGETLSSDTLARMQAWQSSSSGERHDIERTPATDFGIDSEQLRQRFRFYTERFDVPLTTAP